MPDRPGLSWRSSPIPCLNRARATFEFWGQRLAFRAFSRVKHRTASLHSASTGLLTSNTPSSDHSVSGGFAHLSKKLYGHLERKKVPLLNHDAQPDHRYLQCVLFSFHPRHTRTIKVDGETKRKQQLSNLRLHLGDRSALPRQQDISTTHMFNTSS
ncbi:unnamed protein product [Ectocarpus sp. 8 AP-2014]